MMIHVLFALLKGWNFFFHSLMSEVYGLNHRPYDIFSCPRQGSRVNFKE
jgi:hypothetical protein